MSQLCCYVGSINLLVYVLVILFGIASWIDINGLWVELPILVNRLPEKWDLGSYMVIIIQLANIGPLIFTVTVSRYSIKLAEKPVIYIIIGTGAAACLLLAFFWDKTSYVGGVEHSTALLTLQFFLSLVDCTSSVAFLPFMANFRPQYMTAYFLGEGLSGLLPALVALGQGVSNTHCLNKTIYVNETINGTEVNETKHVVYPVYEDPKFTIEVFFFFLFVMLMVSCLAFTLLNVLEVSKVEQVAPAQPLEDELEVAGPVPVDRGLELTNGDRSDELFLNAADGLNSQTQLISSKRPPGISIQKDGEVAVTGLSRQGSLETSHFIVLLVLIAVINALSNGVLPSLQTYSCLPFGNQALHLSVTLSSIANPAACFLAFFLVVHSTGLAAAITTAAVGVGGYVIAMAALSPEPPLVGMTSGVVLSVASWVLVTFLLTYAKVSIAAILRLEGKRALLWCGAITQLGSMVGAILTFLLVNVARLFTQANPCAA